jgi:hypothetical protein
MIKYLVLILTLMVVGANPAFAKSKKSNKTQKSKVTKKVTKTTQEGQLGTSFAFDAASVRGKYQMAGQGIAAVEDEKVLDDLLGLRRSFKDREIQEKARW